MFKSTLQSEQGRKINISLLNFDITMPGGKTHDSPNMPCKVYVHIHDGNVTNRIPVCRDSKRSKSIYVSHSSLIRVWIKHTDSRRTENRFLLNYSGRT